MTNHITCAFALLACLPTPAAGEGRAGDHLDVTAGHTSLLTLPDTDADGLRTAVRIWLHRDHGTLRQTVRGASPGHMVGLYAGVGSARPQPSGLVDGQPPALWSSTAMLDPPRALPVSEDVRLWRWRAAAGRYTVAWTVPYAGDTWGMSGHRDCDCGSPVRVGVAHTRLTVRTGDPGTSGMPDGVPLITDNRSGAVVDVFEGEERVAVVPPGGRWRSRTRGRVLTFSFVEGWRPPSAWRPPTAAAERAALRGGALKRAYTVDDVRLDGACEIVGSDGHDPTQAPPPGGPLTVRCGTRSRAHGATTWRTRRVSRVRATDAWRAERLAAETPVGLYDHRELMRAGFVLDMLREHVAPPTPRALERWPLFAGRASIERAGERWTPIAGAELVVSASSTLPSARGRYAADNVLDGDPTTAWCEGVAGDGMGERLTLRVPGPPRPVLVAVVPGYARGDWHFVANGAPVSLRAAGGAVLTPLRLPDSADLYREGQAVEVLGILSSDAVSLALHGVRPGLRFDDTCLSEVLLFEQR